MISLHVFLPPITTHLFLHAFICWFKCRKGTFYAKSLRNFFMGTFSFLNSFDCCLRSVFPEKKIELHKIPQKCKIAVNDYNEAEE
jgi:hypothetical protein